MNTALRFMMLSSLVSVLLASAGAQAQSHDDSGRWGSASGSSAAGVSSSSSVSRSSSVPLPPEQTLAQVAPFLGVYAVDTAHSDRECGREGTVAKVETQLGKTGWRNLSIEARQSDGYYKFGKGFLVGNYSRSEGGNDIGPTHSTTSYSFDGRKFEYTWTKIGLIIIVPMVESKTTSLKLNSDGSLTFAGYNGDKKLTCHLVRM